MQPMPLSRNGGYALPLLALLLVGLLACIWELHRVNADALPLEQDQVQGQDRAICAGRGYGLFDNL